jgi:hypothetical protein
VWMRERVLLGRPMGSCLEYPQMNAHQITALFEEHGGLKTVHTHPARCRRTGMRGWANTCTCHDGFTRTLTKRESDALAAYKPKEDG